MWRGGGALCALSPFVCLSLLPYTLCVVLGPVGGEGAHCGTSNQCFLFPARSSILWRGWAGRGLMVAWRGEGVKG